mmetsp:Transcript_24523/g.34361  ORF Transcript_24523/g.34361 Transcript_24523/m.34361 type:complete len:210 (+) Transcript_24523:166-795(+)
MVFSKSKPKTKSLLQLGSQSTSTEFIVAPKIFQEDLTFEMPQSENENSSKKKESPASPPPPGKKAVFTPTKEGWGIISWANGDVYDGNVKGHKKHGYGVMTWKVGDQYRGRWNMDAREDDRGRYIYHHGVVYEGAFKKDRRHGEGVLMWPNGDKYVGTWVKGGRKGKGVFISADGFQMKQVWNEAEDSNYSKNIPEKFPKGTVAGTKSP